MGVPYTFAGQAGPIPLAELDADFAALSSGSAFMSPFELDGSPGLPVSLGLKDGQAGNTLWSVNVGVNAVGEFEIINNTAATTPLKINTSGTTTLAAPPTAVPTLILNNFGSNASALQFNYTQTPGGAPCVTVNGSSASGDILGYQVTNSAVGGTLGCFGYGVGNDTSSVFFMGKNNSGSVNRFNNAPSGDLAWLLSGGSTPIAFVTGTFGSFTAQMLITAGTPGNIKSAGPVTSANTVALAAGGSAACGILASSTASLGIFFGTGAPTFAAAQGSIYSNTTGAAGARLYVNTNGGTTWVPAASP
jgi:hypothetical protein